MFSIFQKVKVNNLLACHLLLSSSTSSDADMVSFSQVLKNSLSVEKTLPTFCEKCKKFSPTNQKAQCIDLPNVMSINCGLTNDKDIVFLKRQIESTANGMAPPAAQSSQSSTATTNMKQCRYGLHCTRIGCHFTHAERYGHCLNSISNSLNFFGLCLENRP